MLKRIVLLLTIVLALSGAARAASETPAATPSAAAPTAAVQSSTEVPAAAEEKGGHGLMEVDFMSAFWTLVIFSFLLAILYKGAWKNVLAGLKTREERIRKDIADAEAARLKSEEALKTYNAQLANAEAHARDIIAKATLDAQAMADRIKADADKAATERAARAARDIEDASKQALSEIYAQAAELSTSIAEKILRRNLNAADQRDLVEQSIQQAASVNRG